MAGSTGRPPSKITPYLVYLVFITTLGPFQFGYHLVSKTSLHLVAAALQRLSFILKPGRIECASSRHYL